MSFQFSDVEPGFIHADLIAGLGHDSTEYYSETWRGRKKKHFIGTLELLSLLMLLSIPEMGYGSNKFDLIYTLSPSTLSFLNNPAHINASLVLLMSWAELLV